ncbi:MAG TPA: ABC transporter permease [Acidimicrobiales bacterium]|nr:ABC transporter permease [Acidimicrobiales bacterium]
MTTVPSRPSERLASREPGLPHELRTAAMVWQRELLRFARTRIRILTGFTQPILFLFVLGYGISPLVGTTGGFDFKKFVFPGVVAMSVVSTAIFGAMSIVWDREFGFMREMLVAPASRAALVVGKAAGGATVATLQGTVMLALAPAIGVHLTVLLVLKVVALCLLMAVALTSFGVFLASRIDHMESFGVVVQLVLFPMLFLSGAMFPLSGLPAWLSVLTRVNPLTYAVDPLRRTVFAAQNLPPAARARFPTGVELFGHTLGTASELAIVAGIAAVFLTLSVRAFGRPS